MNMIAIFDECVKIDEDKIRNFIEVYERRIFQIYNNSHLTKANDYEMDMLQNDIRKLKAFLLQEENKDRASPTP